MANKKNELIGTLNDGDIRRAILDGANINSKIKKYVQKKPYFITLQKFKNLKDFQIFKIIEHKKKDNIDVIPILNKKKCVVDLLTLSKLEQKKKIYNDDLKKVPLIIMAGGKGTRLKPFTDVFPKALIPLGEIPAVEHIIQNFKSYQSKIFIGWC